jgi:flagellar basal body-associated protein FliL
MHGFYAPIRIVLYSFLSLMMANLTLITLSLIILITVVYLVFKLIGFFFFSSDKQKHKDTDDSEKTAGSILKGGFRDFKTDLYDWEAEEKNIRTENKRIEKNEKNKLKRPKITRRIRTVQKENKIPRVHPD